METETPHTYGTTRTLHFSSSAKTPETELQRKCLCRYVFAFVFSVKSPGNDPPVTQTSTQKRLCVSVLLDPLELPCDTNTYAEMTMRFCFSTESLELPHNADSCAETPMRFCLSANPLELSHNVDTYAETTMIFCRSTKPPETNPQPN